jgi:biotin carboxylase
MTRDDIICMAREAGAIVNNFHGRFVMYPDGLEHFANLVAAAEREQCAKVCDVYAGFSSNPMNFSENCAEAIRARKGKKK